MSFPDALSELWPRKQSEAMSAASALKVLPPSESPLTVEKANVGHGLNTLRAVLDHAPHEIDEIAEEIADLTEKVGKLQFQKEYLERLLTVAQEYYRQRG